MCPDGPTALAGRLYVTDVSGATVGIEWEGLEAICPGSRFEKGLVELVARSGKRYALC